jgi:hypothetical protein
MMSEKLSKTARASVQAGEGSLKWSLVAFMFQHKPGRMQTRPYKIIDHVSAAWACDDSMQGVGYVTDTTFQWVLIGEPYDEQRDGYGGSKGFITGGTNPAAANATISFHHNLILHSLSRNPLASPIRLLDWRNNIIYNWGACTGNVQLGYTNDLVQTSMPLNVNFVGNKYIPGADSNTVVF